MIGMRNGGGGAVLHGNGRERAPSSGGGRGLLIDPERFSRGGRDSCNCSRTQASTVLGAIAFGKGGPWRIIGRGQQPGPSAMAD